MFHTDSKSATSISRAEERGLNRASGALQHFHRARQIMSSLRFPTPPRCIAAIGSPLTCNHSENVLAKASVKLSSARFLFNQVATKSLHGRILKLPLLETTPGPTGQSVRGLHKRSSGVITRLVRQRGEQIQVRFCPRCWDDCLPKSTPKARANSEEATVEREQWMTKLVLVMVRSSLASGKPRSYKRSLMGFQ